MIDWTEPLRRKRAHKAFMIRGWVALALLAVLLVYTVYVSVQARNDCAKQRCERGVPRYVSNMGGCVCIEVPGR